MIPKDIVYYTSSLLHLLAVCSSPKIIYCHMILSGWCICRNWTKTKIKDFSRIYSIFSNWRTSKALKIKQVLQVLIKSKSLESLKVVGAQSVDHLFKGHKNKWSISKVLLVFHHCLIYSPQVFQDELHKQRLLPLCLKI